MNEEYDRLILQTMACGQCLKSQHCGLDHRTEHAAEAALRCRDELRAMSDEMEARRGVCRQNAHRLDKLLGELQLQHDAARAHVHDVHRQYVALLDKKRQAALDQLAGLHTQQVRRPQKRRTLPYRLDLGGLRWCF